MPQAPALRLRPVLNHSSHNLNLICNNQYNIMNQQHHPAEQQQTSNANTSTSSGPTNNLTNNKTKSPMCLVNELAQYNEIQHKYLRSGVQGSTYKKLYKITLKLGNEEYKEKGTTIKKAQHSAAAMALQHTEYKHPPPKTNQNNSSGMLTPTVMLNALAMKRRETVVYLLENGDPAPQAQPQYQEPPGEPFSIRLRVGEREYPGMGDTIQAARHDAASKAVEDMKRNEINDNQQRPVVTENALPPTDNCNELNTKIKSQISLLHEMASKRHLNVIFEVLSETGPSHMKVFVMQCRVGDFIAEGEGYGKKNSKERAAEKIIEELRKLEPLPTKKSKRGANEKKQLNSVDVNSDQSSDVTAEISPILRLHQIQRANKQKAPVYDVIEKGGGWRCRKFVIRASVNEHYATGAGPNKKTAKRNAAEALLALLGYTNSSDPEDTPKPLIKVEKETEQVEKPQTVEEVQESTAGGSGYQLLPDLSWAYDDESGAFQQSKVILGRSEMLDSGFGSAPTEVKKTGQVQDSQAMQSARAKDQLETWYIKASLEAALEAVNNLLELGSNNATANKDSNAESVHGENSAKP